MAEGFMLVQDGSLKNIMKKGRGKFGGSRIIVRAGVE